MSYDMATQNGKSSSILSGAPATISPELRDAMQLQVARLAIRQGLSLEEARDLLGMLGVAGSEMLSPSGRGRRLTA